MLISILAAKVIRDTDQRFLFISTEAALACVNRAMIRTKTHFLKIIIVTSLTCGAITTIAMTYFHNRTLSLSASRKLWNHHVLPTSSTHKDGGQTSPSTRELWAQYLPPMSPDGQCAVLDKGCDWCMERDSPGGLFLQGIYAKEKAQRLAPCRRLVRVGPAGDGGKMLCVDDIATHCVVYSLGSRLDFSFETDFLRRRRFKRCTVHTFDCTVGSPDQAQIPAGVVFHPWCVGGQNEVKVISSDFEGHDGELGQYLTLDTIMRKLNHSRVDVLKMDIERHEFQVIESLANSSIAPRQMAFETHVHNAYAMWGAPVTYDEWRHLWNVLDRLSYGVVYYETNFHMVCCAEFVVRMF